jgi:hypothetical protein
MYGALLRQTRLKLSSEVDECKPLLRGRDWGREEGDGGRDPGGFGRRREVARRTPRCAVGGAPPAPRRAQQCGAGRAAGRGLHSSTFQLNLSRF